MTTSTHEERSSYHFGCQIRSAMMFSMFARDLTDHYAELLNLAFEVNGALEEAERRIYELEQGKEDE